jgi:hypothetical protein
MTCETPQLRSYSSKSRDLLLENTVACMVREVLNHLTVFWMPVLTPSITEMTAGTALTGIRPAPPRAYRA